MAFDAILAQLIREAFSIRKIKTEEKKMMGGLTFMVKGKMCVGVWKDELMVRLAPEMYDASLKKTGCHPMEFTGKRMKGFVLVDESGYKRPEAMDHWISLALDFNERAKASPRKKKPVKKAVKKSK